PRAARREQETNRFIHTDRGWSPTLSRGFGQAGQTDDAHPWRASFDTRQTILERDDQRRTCFPQHVAQPVSRMVGIERDKWTSCGEACQHCERKQRACRQQDRDQVARLCVGGQSFSKSRGRVPQFTKTEDRPGIPDCDAAWVLAGYALEV